jgi:hypothetical protein
VVEVVECGVLHLLIMVEELVVLVVVDRVEVQQVPLLKQEEMELQILVVEQAEVVEHTL